MIRKFSLFILFIPIFYLGMAYAQENIPDFPVLEGPYLGQKPAGLTPEIFAPGLVSTEENIEFAGTFSPDFKEYFFTRRKAGTIDNRIFHMKYEKGEWSTPELAPFAYDCFEFEPHITPQGDRLFFGSRRPLEASGPLIRTAYIWVTHKTEEGWGPPQFPGPPFDKAMFVCMSDDLTMYNSGLQKSEPVNGQYGPWINIAPHLYGPFMHPCIGPNEGYIIFDTEQDLDGQGNALLISFKNENGTWGDIISFRKILNIEGRYGIPMLSPDGKYLFFSHNGDIYWVDAKIIDKLRV